VQGTHAIWYATIPQTAGPVVEKSPKSRPRHRKSGEIPRLLGEQPQPPDREKCPGPHLRAEQPALFLGAGCVAASEIHMHSSIVCLGRPAGYVPLVAVATHPACAILSRSSLRRP